MRREMSDQVHPHPPAGSDGGSLSTAGGLTVTSIRRTPDRPRFRTTPSDLGLIVLFLVGGLLSPYLLSAGGEGSEVVVRSESGETSFPLSRDQTIQVQGRRGPTLIEIRNGRAHIARSACSNQRWHHGQGWASREGQSLVCVPNQVLVEIRGKGGTAQSPQVDAGVR